MENETVEVPFSIEDLEGDGLGIFLDVMAVLSDVFETDCLVVRFFSDSPS